MDQFIPAIGTVAAALLGVAIYKVTSKYYWVYCSVGACLGVVTLGLVFIDV